MTFDFFRTYCMSKPATSEDFPFDETTLVFRVKGKIFALVDIEERPMHVNLKCDPRHAEELRERYEDVQPGYHMNKKHWNTVNFNGAIPTSELKAMIDESYERVVQSLKKNERDEIQAMRGR